MLTVIITGPTCSGKNAVAHALARLLCGEVISLDSMKVYRYMDVGTAKPGKNKRKEIPYHLVDIVDPCDVFNLGQYVRKALHVTAGIHGRFKPAIFVGGSPLYLRGLVRGFCPAPKSDPSIRSSIKERIEKDGLPGLYTELVKVDPNGASKIHPNDKRRISRALEVYYQTGRPFTDFWKSSAFRLPAETYRIFGLSWAREKLYSRINQRVDMMVAEGLLMEARTVLESFPVPSHTARQCIGYKEIWDGLESGKPEPEIIEQIKLDTRHFARKQLTWFRGFNEIQWIDPRHKNPFEIAVLIAGMLNFEVPALQ